MKRGDRWQREPPGGACDICQDLRVCFTPSATGPLVSLACVWSDICQDLRVCFTIRCAKGGTTAGLGLALAATACICQASKPSTLSLNPNPEP